MIRNIHPDLPIKFIPSPTKQIKFNDGKTMTLNRQQRRANKIFNKDFIHDTSFTRE